MLLYRAGMTKSYQCYAALCSFATCSSPTIAWDATPNANPAEGCQLLAHVGRTCPEQGQGMQGGNGQHIA